MKSFSLAALAASAAVAALAVLTAAPAHATERGVDYCRFGQNASLFLIDRTTPYDETDRRVVIDSIGAVIERLGPGDRITVATIGSHYSVSERLIDECKPGCPVANGPLDGLFGGCSPVIAMRDYRAFQARLVGRIRPLMASSQEAPYSDITGTLAQWTRRPSGSRDFASIYIFSDMLENSQALPWRSFRDMRTEQALAIVRQYQLTPSVSNANVRIVGFGRLHDAGRPPLPADIDFRLRNFWTAYFAAGSARNVAFEGAVTP